MIRRLFNSNINKRPKNIGKRTVIQSYGVLFVEDPDYALMIRGVQDFNIDNWNIISFGKHTFLPYSYSIKAFIVRLLFKKEFDKQKKLKGKRAGLKIFMRKERNDSNK